MHVKLNCCQCSRYGRVVQALQRCQELNDRLVMADWSVELDWSTIGHLPHQTSEPPAKVLTDVERKNALGSGQAIPQSTDEAGVRTLRQNGVLPEYCCFAHVEYLAFVLTHPQMLELQRLVLVRPNTTYCARC